MSAQIRPKGDDLEQQVKHRGISGPTGTLLVLARLATAQTQELHVEGHHR